MRSHIFQFGIMTIVLVTATFNKIIAQDPAPVIEVFGNGYQIYNGDSPSNLKGTNFGEYEVAYDFGLQNIIYIVNTGTATLELINPYIEIYGNEASDFEVLGLGSISIPPNGSTDFVIIFNPSEKGFRSAVVVISSNADDYLFSFEISGIGINSWPYDISLSATSINENVPANSTIATLSTADLDVGDSHTYSLSSGPGDTDNGFFTINGNELRINSSPDFEIKSSYSIRIFTADEDNNFEKSFTITINDINDNIPVVTASQSFSVNENAANSTSVGTVKATDGDAGTTFSGWAITGGNNDGIFAINSSTGAITITNNTNLDYETTTSYNLSVTVSDGVNTSASEIVSININDFNYVPVVTALQSFSIDEDVANSTSVGTVTATDKDAGTTLSGWTITGGNSDGIFAINSSTGAITVADNTILDYEKTTSYSLSVTVSDGTNTSATGTVGITVNDVNDNTPVVTALQSFNIDEDAANSTSVGIVTATDGDAGTTFSGWTITGGNDDGIFTINSATGVITLSDNTNLDYEKTTSYCLSVTVSDGTNTSAAGTAGITVNDVNDNIPVVTALQSFSIDEDAANSTSVGTVLATDGDAGTTYSGWKITGGNDGGIFTINSSTGAITISDNTNLDYEATTSYSLSITVSDGVNTSVVETVNISINDVNDDPGIEFASISSSGTESISSTVIQVNLSSVSHEDVTVEFQVSGTATGNGTDYTLAIGTLTITSGNTSGSINIVDIMDDGSEEDDETVVITLSNPLNATLGTNTTHTYTIIDNDAITGFPDMMVRAINIYPNPCGNTIHLDNFNGDLAKIEIKNLFGQVVMSDFVDRAEIDVSGIKSGAYILSVQSNRQKAKMFKIIKE